MARYAGGGKNTVGSCRSVDVLRWNKLGYLRSPRRFSWAWTRDGKQVASINVETSRHSVTLKYQSRSHGEDRRDVEQRIDIEWTPCRFRMESDHGLYVRLLQTESIAAARLLNCMVPGDCSPAVTAIGLPLRANRNRRISGGSANHERSEWAGRKPEHV